MRILKDSYTSVATNLAIFVALTYYLHFNFSTGMLRLIYLVFLGVFPMVALVNNLVIGNNYNKIVLDNQQNLPHNAEFLDFEDTEEDLDRKAAISTVVNRIRLQRFAMTPLNLTGFYKLLRKQDFTL